MKLWQILLGAGLGVGAVVLLTRSSSPAPEMPADPADQARTLCEHYAALAVNAGRTVTREQYEQCYAQTLANIDALNPARYQCLMAAQTAQDFLDCARQWEGLGSAWG